MKISRTLLRRAAWAVLEKERGFVVQADQPKQGVAPGARLLATKGGTTWHVAVRTSLSRRVRLMPLPDGRWRTVSDVDFVIVAVPAHRNSTAVEVLGFDPKKLIRRFDAALKNAPAAANHDVPVVIALDQKTRRGSRAVPAGLKSDAKWHHVISLDAPILLDVSHRRAPNGFVERVKREFAELIGVDVSDVIVEFKIVS